jgi:cytochrome b
VIAEHAYPWLFLFVLTSPVLVLVGVVLMALALLRWGTSDKQQARFTRLAAKPATGHGFEVKLNTSDESLVIKERENDHG